MNYRWIGVYIAVLLAGEAAAFDVAEFKNGMPRAQVRELLASWRFDRIEDSADATIAYDLPKKGSNRSLRFYFCNDRLAALEQSMKASARNFIVITRNYLTSYGQPLKVDAGVNVIGSGEKNAMLLNWRKGNDIIGVRYQVLPYGEDLYVTHEVQNTCWQSPRSP